MKPDQIFFVFDVESIGLHGDGYAVGYVVKRGDGEHLVDGMYACDPCMANGLVGDRKWVAENIPPLEQNCDDPREVRQYFFERWMEWKEQGALLVADCAWPVEARFLASCIDDAIDGSRNWDGPYPLHDLASVLLAVGKDPLAITERLPSELPAHHPVNDAMQSARILLENL